MFKNVIFITAMLIFFGCANIQVPENFSDFRIICAKSGEILEYEKFINKIAKNDIILIGELHKRPYHHFLEQKITLDLAKFKQISVVFEMASSNTQEIWDQAKQSKHSISANNLKNALKWDKKWDWRYYSIAVEPIFYSDVKMFAGNITKDEILVIYNGAMPLKGDKSVKQDVKNKIKEHIEDTHKIKDNEILDKMMQIQQYKDRRMADKLIQSLKFSDISVLIAGRFHTDRNLGIPLHLYDFDKNKKVVVVALGDENENLDDKNKNSCEYFIEFKEGIKW